MTTRLSSTAGSLGVRPQRIEVGDWITNRERIRSQRMVRHLATAVLASLLLGYLIVTYDSLLDAALIPITIAIALQSTARGISARFGYLWGWPYPEPTASTRLDRWVATVVSRLTSTPPAASSEYNDERVRLLDPWEAD